MNRLDLIRNRALAHWNSGAALRAWLGVDESHPFAVTLPAEGEETEPPMVTVNRIDRVPPLEAGSKCHAGHGYRIEYDEREGGGRRPRRVVFDEPLDLIRFLGKEGELRRFLDLARTIRSRMPRLREWIERHPMEVLAIGDRWPSILDRLEWEPFDDDHSLQAWLDTGHPPPPFAAKAAPTRRGLCSAQGVQSAQSPTDDPPGDTAPGPIRCLTGTPVK